MTDPTSLVDAVRARLAAAGCVAADEEAIELVKAASGPHQLEAWLERREDGEPMAWITGSLRFYGHEVHVDPGVYVPRLQTETLARRAATHLVAASTGARSTSGLGKQVRRSRPPSRAVDLCTGTGAVAVHLMAACPEALVVGVDIDPLAVACARRNGVPVVLSDLERFAPPLLGEAFDVVTVVAPYVPTGELHLLPTDVLRREPRQSIDGGPDGLRLVRRLIAAACRLLRPGGWLLLEIGGDQDEALAPTLAGIEWESARSWADEDGDLRGLEIRRSGSWGG